MKGLRTRHLPEHDEIHDLKRENRKLKSRISELESALEWKEIEKGELPPLIEGRFQKHSPRVLVKRFSSRTQEWLYGVAQYMHGLDGWTEDGGWTHWRIIQEMGEVEGG